MALQRAFSVDMHVYMYLYKYIHIYIYIYIHTHTYVYLVGIMSTVGGGIMLPRSGVLSPLGPIGFVVKQGFCCV